MGKIYNVIVVTVMITTVTTVTTITMLASLGLTSTISLALVVTLIVLLCAKESAGASRYNFPLRLARFASISVWTLAMAFAVIFAVKIAELV